MKTYSEPSGHSRADGKITQPLLLRYYDDVRSFPLIYEKLSADSLPGVDFSSYMLTVHSGMDEKVVSPTLWQHSVSIYIPESTVGPAALLVVGNGGNSPEEGPTDHLGEILLDVARQTSTPVIWLTCVPNQELTFFDDNLRRVEDFSVAKSWRLFMNDPQSSALPLHLPMAGVVTKAMDLACEQLVGRGVNKFILTGASKRGWAAWLAALADDRVVALIPFVAEFLAIKEIVEGMHRSLSGNWPISFIPYFADGVIQDRHDSSFDSLMEVVDPTSYAATKLAKRLGIPKYCISASGDDFFWPDNMSIALAKCPDLALGLTVRVVPNCDHRGIKSLVRENLVPFIRRFQSGITPPTIELRENSLCASGWEIFLSEEVEQVTFWYANNPTLRDFRKSEGIIYHSERIAPVIDDASKVHYPLPLTYPLNQGWNVSFVEAKFRDGFCVTTRAKIEPEGYPELLLGTADRARNHIFRGEGLDGVENLPARDELGCDLQKWALNIFLREKEHERFSRVEALDDGARLAGEMASMVEKDGPSYQLQLDAKESPQGVKLPDISPGTRFWKED